MPYIESSATFQNLYAREVYARRAYAVKGQFLSGREAMGKRLKDRRVEAGLTQVELAKILDVSQETVSRRETGTVPISLDDLHEIADVLQASVGWFGSGQEPRPGPYRPTEKPSRTAGKIRTRQRHAPDVRTRRRRKGNES